MHKIHIDFTGFSPGETDRFIAVLFDYLKKEPEEISLEIRRENTIESFIEVPFPVSAAFRSSGSIPGNTPGTFKDHYLSGADVSPSLTSLKLPMNQVLYVLSDRHYCDFHTVSGTCRTRMNFCEAEKLLPQKLFLNCNRGILLSMAHIKGHTADSFIMSDGSCFSIRTKHKKEIIRQYESFRFLHG